MSKPRARSVGRTRTAWAAVAIIAAVLILPGCRRMWDAEGPPAYRAGYADGCYSGLSAARRLYPYQKDEDRYANDALYREGWDDGRKTCYEDAPPGLVSPLEANGHGLFWW